MRIKTLSLAIFIPVIIWVVWFSITLSKHNIEESRVMVEHQSWYEVVCNDETVLFFSSIDEDSSFVNLSTNRDTTIIKDTKLGHWVNKNWFFPSCRGRIMVDITPAEQLNKDASDLLWINSQYLIKRTEDLQKITDETEYYLSTHSVSDEGFELVVACNQENKKEIVEKDLTIVLMQSMMNENSLKIIHKELYRASYLDENNELKIDTCQLVSNDEGCIIQLNSKKTPSSARAITNIPWQSKSTDETVDITPKEFLKIEKKGVFTDSLGTFFGYVDSEGLYTGYGRYEAFDGSIYEGEWEKGMRDGLGMSASVEKGIRVGDWKEDVFKGEHMTYNSERIYGIDISRYQHEIGKKRYAINWKNMKITSFGNKSNVNAQGEINFPVSFCFIKSTESTTILNKYYANDYTAAKKNGLHVGTYHFFSTKKSGKEQAAWFLKNSKIQEGDLPPVLDVEPLDKQIAAMGGIEELFKQMRQWLNIVERKTGKRPIIYVNQGFVKKYFDLAPDIKANYNVWIARYSEYKPDVHMLMWQLTPYGKVSGIHGNVDINVFNGYEEKFQEFIDTMGESR